MHCSVKKIEPHQVGESFFIQNGNLRKKKEGRVDKKNWLGSCRVPASVMRRIAELSSRAETNSETDIAFDRELFWEVSRKILHVPEAFHWPECEVPAEVLQQLVGQKIASGVHFTHEGKECYAIAICLPEEDLGKVITEAHIIDNLIFLIGVETRYIDMEA